MSRAVCIFFNFFSFSSVPDGDKRPVTLENRREFVQLSAQYQLYESIKEQLEALLGGFYEIIPNDLVTIVCHLLRMEYICLTSVISATSRNWSS